MSSIYIVIKALEDAGMSYQDVEQAVCGYIYGNITNFYNRLHTY